MPGTLLSWLKPASEGKSEPDLKLSPFMQNLNGLIDRINQILTLHVNK